MLAFFISQMGFFAGSVGGVVNGNQLNTESAYSAAMFYALTCITDRARRFSASFAAGP
jgi:NADH-quinone oxidoreductase subunit N